MHSNKLLDLNPLAKGIESRSFLFPNELLEMLPMQPNHATFVSECRQTIKNILSGKDPRLMLLVGPCSIHDVRSALDYAERLKNLSSSLSGTFFVVMRAYVEKPRSGIGWKGLAYDPHLDGTGDIFTGLYSSRQLLLSLAEMEIPAATEFLELTSSLYFGDLISWGCIGARTTESQLHRQLASGLEMPVAFKNNTSGSVEAAVNGILAASCPQKFIAANTLGSLEIVSTKGNPWGHLVLRGGKERPNYDPDSINKAIDILRQAELPPIIFIDCAHDNSYKMHDHQPAVFQSVIRQILEGNRHIRGICLESFLNAGNQTLSTGDADLKYGTSVTDSCIDWETTESLLGWGDKMLRRVGMLLLLFAVLSGCVRHKGLSAFSEYVNREDLASYIIGTPDPSLNYPDVGQRLYISWNLPNEYSDSELLIELTMRFKDRTEIVLPIKLCRISGTYVYELLNDEYFSRKGFLTYKIELFADGLRIENKCHQMWVESINF